MAHFYSTTGVDRLVGGSEDDFFFFFDGYTTKSDTVDGGGGRNALVLVNDVGSTWTVSSANWPIFSKVVGIALLSEVNNGSNAGGFNLTFDNDVFKANKGSRFIIDSTDVGLDGGRLQLNASSVTTMSFDVFGSNFFFKRTGEDVSSHDALRTGAKDDRFIYYSNALTGDSIDGGAGTDTIILSGAGRTISNDSGNKTNPNAFTTITNVKNVEGIVVMDLLEGQSRTIDFGYGGMYKGRNAINITTNRNYGTDKTATAVDGKLIVDGSGIGSASSSLTVNGGNSGDLLIGGVGDDYLSGGKGADLLINGYGSDRLSGGPGDDEFFEDQYLYLGDYQILGGVSGNIGSGKMYGGEGNDVFRFWASSLKDKFTVGVISGGVGIDTLQLSGREISKSTLDSAVISGIEVINLADSGSSLEVSQNFLEKNHDGNGQVLIQNREGSRGGLVAVDASDIIDAKYSVHIAVRSPGMEFLTGGAGNDIFDYSLVRNKTLETGIDSKDTITGGGGIDTILVSEGRSAVLGKMITGVEKLKIVARSNADGETNIVIGTTEAIAIDGSKLSINDNLIALGYFKDPKTGKVYEAKASLSITGGKGDDILTGGRAGDKLYGGDGDDVLTGNKGLDRLTGGKGADHFVFKNTYESLVEAKGRDVITDFHQNEGDKIQFLHDTSTPYSLIGTSTFHGKAGEVRSLFYGSNTYVQLDADGDGDADLGIALTGKIALTSADFLL